MGHHKHLEGNEDPHSHLYQLLSGISFTTVWILDSFVLEFSTFLNTHINGLALLFLALPVFILALYLIKSAEKALFRSGEQSGVIQTGILSHVRHPLYLGVLLIYLACFISTLSLLALLVFIPVFIIHNNMVNYEENDLIRIYGDEYLEYMKKVPKWIPRLKN